MWIGAASSDWAGGGGWGASGVEPNGEVGVLSLLAGMLAGVAAGLVEVRLAAGTTGGESGDGCLGSAGAGDAEAGCEGESAVDWLGSAGAGDAAAGLEDPASSVGAVGM
ncbi:hypothetical protein V6N12_028738 [Hibiscus sabdariffa]|uniref:Uncharacterized protein n=1 Tax=Hibiscus sabdariffa TaxID=183260 RepID=A0ABR2F6P5_9ROSI